MNSTGTPGDATCKAQLKVMNFPEEKKRRKGGPGGTQQSGQRVDRYPYQVGTVMVISYHCAPVILPDRLGQSFKTLASVTGTIINGNSVFFCKKTQSRRSGAEVHTSLQVVSPQICKPCSCGQTDSKVVHSRYSRSLYMKIANIKKDTKGKTAGRIYP